MRVVVVNRGEIAVRIVRTARARGYRTLVVHTGAEREAPQVRLADEAVELPGEGVPAYLDIPSVVAAATRAGRGAVVHPGYGFPSEHPEFARACAEAGLVFVGPDPGVLATFGDTVAARAAAERAGLPVLPGTAVGADLDAAAALLASHPDGVMVKAAAGGGGRGLREVRVADELAAAWAQCRDEARAAFGDDLVFAEALVTGARHIEIQVVADGAHARAVGDRDCSVQRRRQKLVEIAPADGLGAGMRAQLYRAAVDIAESVACRGVITVEFLVRGEQAWFLEVNPRLQVEHTVTEETTGLDLVGIQFDLAAGRTLAELQLPDTTPRGYAVQARVNAEILDPAGQVLPSSGVLTRFEPPTGAGVRVDTAVGAGMRHTVHFDSLLAKIVVRADSRAAALRRCADALAETVVAGVGTNAPVLRAVTAELAESEPVDTGWFERRAADFACAAEAAAPQAAAPAGGAPVAAPDPGLGAGERAFTTPMGATVVELAEPGTLVAAGGRVAVLEAMK